MSSVPDQPTNVRPTRMWPLFVGGFMGPFGGGMVTPMLPELAAGLTIDLTTVTGAVTAYMIPFALGMLVSGTLANRIGQSRTVKIAFFVYAVASLVCVVATGPVLFFAGRGVQGLANAFTSPVLIALITRTTPQDQLGQAFGRYTSMAAAGQAFAPLIGGLAAGWDYRGAFVATAVVGVILALLVPKVPEPAISAGTQWRSLANLRLLRAAVFAFGFQSAAYGVVLVGALIASDRFGLSPGWRGAVVAVFGVMGFAGGPLIGKFGDKWGIQRIALGGVVVLTLMVAAIGWVPWLWGLVLLVAVAGVAGIGARIGANTFAVRSTPNNTSGATSIMMFGQFVGTAIVPALVLPLYVQSAGYAALAAAGFGVIGIAACLFRPKPASSPA